MLTGNAQTRRRFAAGIVYGLSTAMGALLSVPAFAYLLAPKAASRRKDFLDIGDIASLVPGEPQQWTYERIRRDGWKTIREKATTWVVKRNNNTILALHPSCTHLGCAYHWEASQNQFNCPCHTSSFNVDGEVLGGPAPRALDRYETRVQAGRLLIGPVLPTSSAPSKEEQSPV